MSSSKLYFQNKLDVSLHILLWPNKGCLEIHIFDQPFVGATEAPAGKLLSFDVNDEIRACVRGRSLAFEFIGHNPRVHFALVAGRSDQLPDGPIFQLNPV